jgi:signal transduction histidine kinase
MVLDKRPGGAGFAFGAWLAPSPVAPAAKVEPAARRILEVVTRAIEHNAVRGRELAATIHETRRQSLWLSIGLTSICVLLAVVVAWQLHRQSRTRRALFDSHTKSLETRAAELEQFAGRVAHDIRNPLSAARMAAELASRKNSDEAVGNNIHRIIRSLSRADAITTALLDFARLGPSRIRVPGSSPGRSSPMWWAASRPKRSRPVSTFIPSRFHPSWSHAVRAST